MKIKNLQLKNFKRFTDLTLQGIPDNAKLVLLIGSNGSGKSSVFDAFGKVAEPYVDYDNPAPLTYTRADKVKKDSSRKNKEDQISISILADDNLKYTSIDNLRNKELKINNFYGRSSFRQIPRLTRTNLGDANFSIENNSDRPISFIDRDERFENDVENILGKLLKEFFRTDDNKSEIKKNVIDPINESLNRIFNKENGTKLQLIEIIPPLEGNVAAINFRKGESEFHYNYLSAGEKEVFNILLNLVARIEYYQDTVFFFDEIDLHLNTQLQYNFIKEIIENWIPENCQFWTASHSLGFIQYAKESDQAAIFDFKDIDFDYPKILAPEPKDNPDIYEIAVNKELLSELFKDYSIYFVENKDRTYYSAIGMQNIMFVQSNNKKSVYHKTKNGEFNGIVDRDFLTDNDIEEVEKQYQKLKILRLYSIENYLYHPKNLEEYYQLNNKDFNIDEYKKAIFEEKESVKSKINIRLAITRTSYSFFDEPEHDGKPNQKRFKSSEENFTQVAEIQMYLDSGDFETFYKVFPMKDYATQLKERQNISPSALAKTNWFKTQIENIIK
jgi:AAA15 family ATPase/GTPase